MTCAPWEVLNDNFEASCELLVLCCGMVLFLPNKRGLLKRDLVYCSMSCTPEGCSEVLWTRIESRPLERRWVWRRGHEFRIVQKGLYVQNKSRNLSDKIDHVVRIVCSEQKILQLLCALRRGMHWCSSWQLVFGNVPNTCGICDGDLRFQRV